MVLEKNKYLKSFFGFFSGCQYDVIFGDGLFASAEYRC